MEILVKAEVHRIVITDTERRVVGVVSLSDILQHLVLDHAKSAPHGQNECSCPRSTPINLIIPPSTSVGSAAAAGAGAAMSGKSTFVRFALH